MDLTDPLVEQVIEQPFQIATSDRDGQSRRRQQDPTGGMIREVVNVKIANPSRLAIGELELDRCAPLPWANGAYAPASPCVLVFRINSLPL